MAKKPLFRSEPKEGVPPSDPETLFRDLSGRAKEIKHLWSHQADLLRSYSKSFKASEDVAIELPTGTGKTLVGLLIGEFRRRTLGQRIVYLCPTRQLARQVSTQAASYGIDARVFVGRQAEYSASDFTAYEEAHAIAVTTYSGVFNSNPRLNDAQTLLLDDAHAAENYIAGMWSLGINRSDHERAFFSVVRLLRSGLPEAFASDILGDHEIRRPGEIVELVPGGILRANSAALRGLLDAAFVEGSHEQWAWKEIREKLFGCLMLVEVGSESG